jgi:hypothetical protein
VAVESRVCPVHLARIAGPAYPGLPWFRGVSDISYRLSGVYAVGTPRIANVSREWHFVDTNCERVDSIDMVVRRQAIEVRTRMEWFLIDWLRFQRAEPLQFPEDFRCRSAFGNT